MRRKVGVSAVRKRQNEATQFTKVGKALEENKISFVQETLTTFKNALADFASKHKNEINSDPEFRQQFHAMCIAAGVDPLASSKGFWSDVLGVGDFYFELGVKIIQITVQARAATGGIMALTDLLGKLNATSKSKIAREDIYRAVEKIAVLGSGFHMINNKSENPLIVSIPLEVNTDHEYLIDTAQLHDGCVSEDVVVRTYGWTTERFHIVMNPLIQEGIVWIDEYKGERRYYFPALWKTEI